MIKRRYKSHVRVEYQLLSNENAFWNKIPKTGMIPKLGNVWYNNQTPRLVELNRSKILEHPLKPYFFLNDKTLTYLFYVKEKSLKKSLELLTIVKDVSWIFFNYERTTKWRNYIYGFKNEIILGNIFERNNKK